MGWYAEFLFLLLIRYATVTGLPSINFPQNFIAEDTQQSEDNTGNEEFVTNLNQYEDFRLEQLGKLLTGVLLQPWPTNVSPILYFENDASEELPVHDNVEIDGMNNIPLKRTRYYRKYPWKRQNSRYDAENRYLCQPTKEDVFRLLVALHEARQGNRGQMVNFCNRKRPASAVFTNIRFLG